MGSALVLSGGEWVPHGLHTGPEERVPHGFRNVSERRRVGSTMVVRGGERVPHGLGKGASRPVVNRPMRACGETGVQ